MSTRVGMSKRLFNCAKKKAKSPSACRNPRISQCWHGVESDFTHILSERAVNTASPEISPHLSTCLLHLLLSPYLNPTHLFPFIFFYIFFCWQEPAWSAERACTERTTPARRWTACITHAASPVCPVVSQHTQTHTLWAVLAQPSNSDCGNDWIICSFSVNSCNYVTERAEKKLAHVHITTFGNKNDTTVGGKKEAGWSRGLFLPRFSHTFSTSRQTASCCINNVSRLLASCISIYYEHLWRV